MKKDLKKKLIGYSAVTGAALMVLPSCKKDSNINEASTISKNTLAAAVNTVDSCTIDFDGDGNVDVTITTSRYQYTYYGYTQDYGYSTAYGRNGAMILTQQGSLTVGPYTYNYNAATKLSAGTEIGPASDSFTTYGALSAEGTMYGYNISGGQFLSSEGYFGVKFTAAGNTHYGWVKVSTNATADGATISEAAFDTRPDTPIKAGSK